MLKASGKLKTQLSYVRTACLVVLSLFLINGCSLSSATTELKSSTFVNKLDQENHGLNPKDDAQLLNSHSLKNLPVVKSSGEKVDIDFSQQPVIFVAYWCPGCQRELVLLNNNKEKFNKLPIIICTGFNKIDKNTSLNDAVRIIDQGFNNLRIQGFTTYYSMTDPSNKDVPEYPCVIYPKDNNLFRLTGEHTLDVFIRAFN